MLACLSVLFLFVFSVFFYCCFGLICFGPFWSVLLMSCLDFVCFACFVRSFVRFVCSPVLLTRVCMIHACVLCAPFYDIYMIYCIQVNCPFFYKIGACRHGDRCSRQHHKPPFSQTILVQNLYQNPVSAIMAAGGDPSQLPKDHVQDDVRLLFVVAVGLGLFASCMIICTNQFFRVLFQSTATFKGS